MLEPLLHPNFLPPNSVYTMSNTDSRIHTALPPLTVEQYHDLIKRLDGVALKLERVMRLMDELYVALDIPGHELH